jgi:hypothetical protein
MKLFGHLSVMVVALSACSESDDSDPAPTTPGMTITSSEIDLAPGQERWVCWSFPVDTPFEMIATDVVSSSPAFHHYQLFKTTADPAMNATDCDGLGIRDAVWLSVGGADTPGVRYPDGAAMKVTGFVLLQLHILNASDAMLTVPKFEMNMVGSAAEGLLPVGVLVVAPTDLVIPPQSTGVVISGTCNPAEPIENIIAIYPHMHRLGEHIRVGVTAGAAPRTDLVDIEWDFDNQGVYDVTGSALPQDQLHVDCTYNNPGNTTVTFGESTTDEMCAGIIYHYPATTEFGFCGGR